jgi:hypothetical protein
MMLMADDEPERTKKYFSDQLDNEEVLYVFHKHPVVMLGFGTIMMQTYVGDLVIHDVHHPAKTQKQIVDILRAEGITSAPYQANEQTIIADETSE